MHIYSPQKRNVNIQNTFDTLPCMLSNLVFNFSLFVTTTGLVFWWTITLQFHFKFCVCLAFSHTAQPKGLQVHSASTHPRDTFNWTMNQKMQRYPLISVMRDKITTTFPWNVRTREIWWGHSVAYCQLWRMGAQFSYLCHFPSLLDHKRPLGNNMLPTQLGRVLSGQLIKTFIPSLPNSVHFNLFNSHRKSKLKSEKSHIVTQL